MNKFTFIFLFFSSFSYSQQILIVHCADGTCPKGAASSNDLVVREIFVYSNNGTTKFADWVAYRVTRETIGTSSSLNRSWRSDDLLDSNDTLEPNDYRNANAEIEIDRGHQAPLASFAGTVFWRSTNILSNITPQKSELNQGPWLDLESAIRAAVFDSGDLYVVTGPLYDDQENQVQLPEADESHIVPTGYFKVVATESGRVSAFLFDQDDTNDSNPYCSATVTLQEIEDESGLTIFPTNAEWPTGDLDLLLGC